MNPLKLALARALDASRIHAALLGLQRAALGPHLRIVNYHDVPPSRASAFEAQLAFYAERFAPARLTDLPDLRAGRWERDRPGLILCFDDGLRSHADVVAPLLERYGFSGCFLVPVDFVDAEPSEQVRFASEHRIQFGPEFADGRIALSWDDVRRLDRDHLIGCHTSSHRRLAATLSGEELDREIPRAKLRLEQEIGHPVEVFAWVGGEEWSYSAEAARAVRDAGFRVGLMTHSAPVRPGTDPLQLQRSNVEASFPPELLRFQLCGLPDLLAAGRRRRVTRLTRP